MTSRKHHKGQFQIEGLEAGLSLSTIGSYAIGSSGFDVTTIGPATVSRSASSYHPGGANFALGKSTQTIQALGTWTISTKNGGEVVSSNSVPATAERHGDGALSVIAAHDANSRVSPWMPIRGA